MADSRSVLIEFRGDAASFVAAVKEMTALMQKFNKTMQETAKEEKATEKQTVVLEQKQKQLGATSIATGNLMAQAIQRGMQWASSMGNTLRDTAVETYKLQLILGGSAQQMSGLRAAANSLKIPFDALIVSYGTFAQQVASGTKAAGALGITLRDQQGNIRPSIDLIKEAADKLNSMGNETLRTDAARQLFGRRFKELMPLLSEGSAGIQALTDKMKAMGLTIDESGVKKGLEFQRTQTNLKQAMQGLSLTLSQSVVPAITNMLLGLSGMIQGISSFLKAHPAFVTALKVVALAVGAIALNYKLMNSWIPMTLRGIGMLIPQLGSLASAWTGVAVAEEGAATAGAAAATGGLSLLVTGGIMAGGWLLSKVLGGGAGKARKLLPTDQSASTNIDSSTQDLQDAISKLSAGGGSAKQNPALEKAKKHLDYVKKFWDAQIKAAKDALQATQDAAKAYEDTVKQIADAVKKTAEVPSLITESFAQYMGPSALIKAFQKKVNDARDFLSALTRLRDAGLDPGILGQLAAAGPQAGLQAAKVILSDVGTIARLNDLQTELTGYAQQTGLLTGQYTQAESYAAEQKIDPLTKALAATQSNAASAIKTATQAVNNLNVTVNTMSNSDPSKIAGTVAWMVATGTGNYNMHVNKPTGFNNATSPFSQNYVAMQNAQAYENATAGQFKTTPYGM